MSTRRDAGALPQRLRRGRPPSDPVCRALRRDGPFSEPAESAEDTQGYLYPDFEAREIKRRNGSFTRPAEVVTLKGMVQPGKGTSLLGDPEFFIQRYWRDFLIPEGTDIPATIKIMRRGTTKTGRGKAEKKTPHYQIELINPATQEAFKGALDTLARNAYAKLHADARTGT